MKKKKNPTIRQIADLAGVSASTVSLVMNGKGDISSATRSRILEVVSSLNYTPRIVKARANTPKTIKFLKIAKHGHTVNRDHSNFISDYIDGMSSEATARGYKLQVVSHEETPVRDIAGTIINSDATGVIALGTELTADDIQTLQDCRLPTVFIDTFYDIIDANFIDMNNGDAVYKVLAHFKDLGFSKIGFVGSNAETRNFTLRRDAFYRNMELLGLSANPDYVLTVDSTLTAAYEDSLNLLNADRPLAEAYFCTNDVMAYGFTKALKEKGYKIPHDISVVGFDNLPMSAALDPALTTIDVSKRTIGSMAITVLDDLINASEWSPPIKVLVGAELILRSSVAKRR